MSETPALSDPLWWLSFVDPDKAPPLEEQRPGGPSFLGVAIVQAPDYLEAVRRAHRLGINPGGEVAGFGPIGVDEVAEEWCHRLLTATEANIAGGGMEEHADDR